MTQLQSSPRVLFIDLLRGLAIVAMVEAHCFNSLLQPSLKQSWWFSILDSLNGLIAPAFLFVSGWVFALASRRKLEDFRSGGPAFRRQFLRIALIWALGYGLHIPHFSYRRLRDATREVAWQQLYQVDILHCIAAGLVLLLVARIVFRSDRLLQMSLWISSAVIVGVTPFFWDNFWNATLPAALAGYFGEYQNALFPMFPWLGFLFFGSACSNAYFLRQSDAWPRQFVQRLALIGMALFLAGCFFSLYGFPWRYGSENVRAQPLFFALRLGGVFLLTWACWTCQEHQITRGGWMQTLGQESLLVYVGHVVILYRLPDGERSFAASYSHSLGLGQSIAATGGLIFLMFMAARGWSWLKSQHRPLSRFLAYATGTGTVLLFFVR